MSAALELVRRVYEAAAQEGPRVLVERYEDWFTDDFAWTPILLNSLDGRAYRGRSEFASYWDEFLEVFSDPKLGPGSFASPSEGQVLITARLRMQGAGSGAPVDREVAYLFEVDPDDGRIRAGRTFFSPADARDYLADHAERTA